MIKMEPKVSQNGTKREPKRDKDLQKDPLRNSSEKVRKKGGPPNVFWEEFWLHFGPKTVKNDVPKTSKKLMSKIPDFPQFSTPKMMKNEVKK